MLQLKINKKDIEIIEQEEFVRGTVGARCEIEFDTTAWSNTTNTIVFKRCDMKPINIIADSLNPTLTIPYEVLSESGSFKIGVFGTADGIVTPTLWCDEIKVRYGTDTHGTEPTDYTPSEIEQIKSQVNNKQNKLTAGKNITISEDNVISADGATLYNVKAKGENILLVEDIGDDNRIANIKLVCDTMTDFTNLSVYCYGKNIYNGGDIGAKTASTYVKLIENGKITKPIVVSATENNLQLKTKIWRVRAKYQNGTFRYIMDGDFPKGFSASNENPIVELLIRDEYILSGSYSNIQIEYGYIATGYVEYTEPEIYAVKSDGIVGTIPAKSNKAILYCEKNGVYIECNYFKDLETALNKKQAKLIAGADIDIQGNVISAKVPLVDQQYKSDSSNSQSGTAVAQAVNNRVPKPKIMQGAPVTSVLTVYHSDYTEDENGNAIANDSAFSSTIIDTGDPGVSPKEQVSSAARWIVSRDKKGNLWTGTPIDDQDCVQKKQLDDLKNTTETISNINATKLITSIGVDKGVTYTFDWNAMYFFKSNSGKTDLTFLDSDDNNIIDDLKTSYGVLILPKTSYFRSEWSISADPTKYDIVDGNHKQEQLHGLFAGMTDKTALVTTDKIQMLQFDLNPDKTISVTPPNSSVIIYKISF